MYFARTFKRKDEQIMEEQTEVLWNGKAFFHEQFQKRTIAKRQTKRISQERIIEPQEKLHQSGSNIIPDYGQKVTSFSWTEVISEEKLFCTLASQAPTILS